MRTQPVFFINMALGNTFPHAVASVLDQEYATLTEEAWASMHSSFIYSMNQRGLPEWLAEKGDCDDWAWLFRAWLIERNWRQPESAVPVACCYLHYTTQHGTPHAINAAVIRRGEALAVLPIEPQPGGGPFEMTEAERLSCTLYII